MSRIHTKHFSPKNSTTRSKATFHRPNVNTVYNGEQSLRNFGPIVWDKMLPENIKQITDLDTFKGRLKIGCQVTVPVDCAKTSYRNWVL